VVDRLSKYARFMPLSPPYSASDVAQVFLDFVFKLHFWQELMSLQGVQLRLSSSYHTQTNGQTKVVNRVLETYLRCMCSDAPTFWSKWENRMKQNVDKHRSERIFEVGNFVFVKLHPYISVANKINAKLSSNFFGPF